MPSTSVRNPKKRSANASGVIRPQSPVIASSSSGDNLQADLVEQEAGKRKKRPSPLLTSSELPKEIDSLSISDLLPEDQVWALKNSAAKATETIRTRTIKVASGPWRDYIKYRQMALNAPNELTSVPKSELHKIFRDDQHQFTASNEVISGMLQRLSYVACLLGGEWIVSPPLDRPSKGDTRGETQMRRLWVNQYTFIFKTLRAYSSRCCRRWIVKMRLKEKTMNKRMTTRTWIRCYYCWPMPCGLGVRPEHLNMP